MFYKKSQIIGQVFVYIMAVIIIGVIAVVGFSAIKSVVGKGCQVEQLNFRADISAALDKYTSFGSVNKEAYAAPCSYDSICFVSASRVGVSTGLDPSKCNNKIINETIASNAQINIFVTTGTKTMALGYSPQIMLNSTNVDGCLCIKQRNKNFYIIFAGQGSGTEISAS